MTNSIATATLGTVALTYTGPTNVTENPSNDIRVFEASANVSTNDARLESIGFENRGTSSDGDLVNLRLYVDGTQVGSPVASFTNDVATFDLTSNPVLLKTGTRIIKVIGDIVKGSSETYDLQVRRAADIRVIDAQLNQAILVTDAGGSFPVSAATANTIAAGTLSVVKANTSPTSNITLSATNALWTVLEFRAAGEDVKIEAVTVDVDTTAGNGMDNVKIFVNDSQIGSTKDVGGASSETGTEFTFGSSFIAKAGEVTTVKIYGDAKTAAGTDFADASTANVGLSIAAADTEGMSSGNAVSAISIVDGNSLTVSAASLTASKYSSYSDKTLVAGTNNAKIGSFALSAGSSEGININTIVVNLNDPGYSSITDLMLKDTSGNQIGTSKSSPSTANTFSVNISLAASASKVIDIYANIKTGAGAGSVIATVDYTTGGQGMVTANTTNVGSSSGSNVTLQTITIASGGTLTVTENSGDVNNRNIVSGTSSEVKVGTFKFVATNSSFTVNELKVKIPSNAASIVSSVILKSGSTQLASGLPISSTTAYATTTFTGMTFSVPQGTAGVNLDVYVTVSDVNETKATGKAISVVLDYNEGFKATDNGSGTTDTTLAAADLNSAVSTGFGTMYVRKSVPTLSAVLLVPATAENPNPVQPLLTNSTTKLARVKIAADSAGEISWKKVVFYVDKTAAVSVGATTTLALYDVDSDLEIDGTFATTTGNLLGGLDALDNLETGSLVFVATTEQSILGGQSKTYELRGDIGGVTTDYDTLTVSIESTSTSAATAAFATIHTAVGDSSESFVWSDKSVTSHDESTLDWSNDYLVKNLALTLNALKSK